ISVLHPDHGVLRLPALSRKPRMIKWLKQASLIQECRLIGASAGRRRFNYCYGIFHFIQDLGAEPSRAA
ncbi:MAG: hypothetical protein ACP5I1_05220, partial [Candidatus Hinthialibacter sp.]